MIKIANGSLFNDFGKYPIRLSVEASNWSYFFIWTGHNLQSYQASFSCHAKHYVLIKIEKKSNLYLVRGVSVFKA